MFVPLLNKSFNLSTVEKFIGDISATTFWIDYLVDMATQVVLWRVISSMKGHPGHLRGQTCKIQDS